MRRPGEPLTTNSFPKRLPTWFPFQYTDNETICKTMEYRGRIGQVLEEVTKLSRHRVFGDKFWMPARLVRGVVDSDLSGLDRIEMLNDTTDLAIRMYGGLPRKEMLKRVSAGLEKFGLLDRVVEQQPDATTAVALNPALSKRVSESIGNLTSNKNVMIANCHGGLVAGIECFLYGKRGGQDTAIYPIRNSLNKANDLKPYINQDELHYIENLASDGRPIMVVDEDSSSGATLVSTIYYLHEHLPSEHYIFGTALEDLRPSSLALKQGQFWEKVHPKHSEMGYYYRVPPNYDWAAKQP